MNLSVVVPLYNRAGTIEQSVRSVLEQTEPVLEVIVVDDGSSDESAHVVQAIDEARVRYVRQGNAGAGAARNRGLDLAGGEWVAFLDSDDWWKPGRVSAAVEAIEAEPTIDVLQANRLHVYPDGAVDRGLKAPPARMRDPIALLGGFTIKTSAVMIRRSLIEAHGLRFPTDQKTCEDYHLFWRALLVARSVAFTEATDVMIRALPDSLSRANSAAYLQKDNIKTLIEVRTWARAKNVRTDYIDALTEHLHWQFRDYFVMLMRTGRMTMLLRYAALAAQQEGLARGVRGLVSAVRGLGGVPTATDR